MASQQLACCVPLQRRTLHLCCHNTLQTKRSRKASASPPVAKRVGGGYEVHFAEQGSSTDTAAAAALAADDAGKLLQGLQGPLTEQDLCIIKHILQHAEGTAVEDARTGRAAGIHIGLAHLLEAYDAVLPQHGLLAQADTHYYRILLKLALDPNHDWWDRFHRECSLWARWGSGWQHAVRLAGWRGSYWWHVVQQGT